MTTSAADEEIRRVEVDVPMIGNPPRPPLNMNQRLHWTVERKLSGMVRRGVAYRVRGLRLGAARFLVVGLHYRPGDNRRRDPANLQATQKPAVDALVDAGLVPDDTPERLSILLRGHGHKPGWHYHLIDVENLAAGFLAGLSRHGHSEVTCGPLCGQGGAEMISPPWKSDDLSRAIGIEPPVDGVRHTAMGDARWARAVYDAVMGGVRSVG